MAPENEQFPKSEEDESVGSEWYVPGRSYQHAGEKPVRLLIEGAPVRLKQHAKERLKGLIPDEAYTVLDYHTMDGEFSYTVKDKEGNTHTLMDQDIELDA